MNKTVRYILYVVITAICIMAIFIGVYSFIFKDAKVKSNEVDPETNTTLSTTLAETKDKFKDLFTNQFFDTNSENSNIQKVVADKPIVYEALTVEKTVDGVYSINAHIPGININTDVAKSYNQMTAKSIINKINEIQKNGEEPANTRSKQSTQVNTNVNQVQQSGVSQTSNNQVQQSDVSQTNNQNVYDQQLNENQIQQQVTNQVTSNYTVCNVTFTGYVNNNILSVAMLITLKEGNNPQRTMVQTYNYNLQTGQDVKITDILQNRGLDANAVNKKIKTEIKQAASQAESVSQSGYSVYQRDSESEIYNVVNSNTFIQGPNGELYIIYAYGNSNYTSEMDVIQI